MAGTTQAAHATNLKAAQKGSLKNSAQKAKQIISAGSLSRYIDPFIDWLFAIALMLAILKDISDILTTTLLVAGGLGEMLVFIFTSFTSIFIFLIMIITGSTGNVKLAKSIIKKTLLLLATAMAEMIPIIDLLPMESILVVVVFWITLRDRRKAAQGNN
jgi:hypothetical protein